MSSDGMEAAVASTPSKCTTSAAPVSSTLTRRKVIKTEMSDNRSPDRGHGQATRTTRDLPSSSWAEGKQWIILSIASGVCAALNGVFAKLTTTDLTSQISQAVAGFLDLAATKGAIELVVRCTFFGLNLLFNAVMWTLFTKALARGSSTTQVSIMNTSSNFVITALLGFIIFAESLPPLWWLGAAMLVAGNVIIGRKDETSSSSSSSSNSSSNSSRSVEEANGDGTVAVSAPEAIPFSSGDLSPPTPLLPVEKNGDGDEVVVDQDVPLIGDLEGPDTVTRVV